MTYGPDPDKGAYRFAINRQIDRWKALRPRWVDLMGEDSAANIDAELKRGLDPANLDDATHGKDLAEFLERQINEFERTLAMHAETADLPSPETPPFVRPRPDLSTERRAEPYRLPRMSRPSPKEVIERIRNSSREAPRGLDPAHLEGLVPGVVEQSMTWRWHPKLAELDKQEILLTHSSCGAGFRYSAVFAWQGRPAKVCWLGGHEDEFRELLREGPAKVRLYLTETGGIMRWTDGARQLSQELTAVEVTWPAEGPRTSLPGLIVKIPEALPEDLEGLTDEDRVEAAARLVEAQKLAGVYQKQIDPRDPRQVMLEDDLRAMRAAGTKKEEAKKTGFVAPWSDDPTRRSSKLEDLVKGLTAIYEAVGLKVVAIGLIPSVRPLKLSIMFADDRRFVVEIPESLEKLIKEE